MGRWITANIGCSLSFEDGRYTRRCPISIADLRLGISPAFAADADGRGGVPKAVGQR
jgi:hypothetical protein